MHLNPTTTLWVYILLLLVGGLIGFFKAGSKVSLLSSAVSAAILILCTVGLFKAAVAEAVINLVLAALIVVFALRLAKTKKFMPSGLMLVVTVAALALRHFLKG